MYLKIITKNISITSFLRLPPYFLDFLVVLLNFPCFLVCFFEFLFTLLTFSITQLKQKCSWYYKFANFFTNILKMDTENSTETPIPECWSARHYIS